MTKNTRTPAHRNPLQSPRATRGLRPPTPRLLAFALPLALAAFASSGCDAPPPTNTDDVVDYTRNAVVGAKLRRLDPAAQEYVDHVFQAYMNWQARCAPVEKLADLDTLAPLDSDEWRELDRVRKTLDTVREFKADEPDESDEKAKTRAQWFDALHAAVTNVPDLPPGSTTDLASAVSDELDADNHDARIRRLADDFESLYAVVMDNATDFDPDKSGLAFRSASVTRRAEQSWNRLHSALADARLAEREDVETVLTSGKDAREKAIRKKATMHKAGVTTEAERRSFRRLELLIHYHDARIKTAEKRRRKLTDQPPPA